MKLDFQQAVACDVLLVAYGGGHVQMLMPVARQLKAKGAKVVFLALTTARPVLEASEIDFITYADFPAQSEEALAHGARLAGRLEANPNIPQADTVAYLGLNYESLEKQLGAAGAAEMYADQGRACFYPLDVFVNLFKLMLPKVVVATNSPRSERAAIEAAGQMFIPSVCVIDLFARREIEWIGQEGFATALCVLNQEVKTSFVDYGRAEDQIHVTGNPAFDPLFDPALQAAGQALSTRRGWNNQLLNVLWASQPEPESHPYSSDLKGDTSLPEQVEQALRRAVLNNPGIRLIVRYHPSQNCEFVQQDRVCHSSAEEDISAVLCAMDLVITMTSTVGLQAHLLGKPVLTFDNTIFHEDMPYSRMGISTGFSSLEALQAYVQKLSRDELSQGRAQIPAAKQDSAAQRICSLILEQL